MVVSLKRDFLKLGCKITDNSSKHLIKYNKIRFFNMVRPSEQPFGEYVFIANYHELIKNFQSVGMKFYSLSLERLL